SGGNVAVLEDSGAYSAAWATGVSAGPPDESSQSINFTVTNDNNALFSAQPAISPSGVLTFTPAANANGNATVTVTLHDDGGTANGGADTSAAVTFTIHVTPVNDAPSFTPGGNVAIDENSGAYAAPWATAISAGPANDTWATFGNTELRVDLAAASTPTVVRTTASGRGVLDSDTDSDADLLFVSGIVGCGDAVAPYDCTFASGKLSMNANGTFSFIPAPGVTSASFQYQVTDVPSFGVPMTSTGTVTITFTPMIW